MSEQTVDFAQVVSIIVALIGVLGTLIGAFITARLALRNYRDEKVADRDYYRQQKDADRDYYLEQKKIDRGVYRDQKEADRDYYKQQKEIDRQTEATKTRAQSYKSYLTAYANVQAFPPDGATAAYVKLYDKYYDAYHNLFQVAADNVFRATTAFHQIAWLERIPDKGEERQRYIEEWKRRYAQMLIEMRADAFEKTDIPVEEIAQRLPWVWGDTATVNGQVTFPERSSEAHDEEREVPVEGERG